MGVYVIWVDVQGMFGCLRIKFGDEISTGSSLLIA